MRTIQRIAWYAVALVVVVVGVWFGLLQGGLGLMLGGAGVATPTSPRGQSPESPREQTPVSPREETAVVAVVQTPTAPPPAPGPVAPKPKKKPPTLDLAKIKDLHEGMTEEEVMALLGQPGFLMSQAGDETSVYRWTEPGGAALLARFKGGKLERKNLVNAKGVEQENAPQLTREQYDSLAPGMTLPEVLVLVGIDPKSQTANQSGVSLVRWADAQGSSFSARFENGKLVRKTGFHVSTSAARKMRESSPNASPSDEEELADAGEITGDAAPGEEIVPVEEKAEAPAKNAKGTKTKDAKAKDERKPRVRVAGGKSNEDDAGSYRPKAKLPTFAHGLRKGSFEISIRNPSTHKVSAGLRSGNRGIDVEIPPKSKRSVKVDRGAYSFFFVSDGDPYTLNTGTGVNLNSMFATDIEISIVDEDFEVRPLDSGR